ncbi:MAG: D-alanine--D-alanine ligase family protein [Patescibacteria group bacterium]|nr:D-alanine--D-alanine ligase family protein [bacterium]MDZ4240700.1 D-alanine--D-alanine ligase family protein [Patescibacteria group bacterium]
MPKIVVGVLRGGPSSEYEVSLKTGASVLTHLPEKYVGHDIFISRDGTWHSQGVPRPLSKIVKKVDVVFNALHGSYGEDGKVQRLLEHFGVPYTGSGPLASAVGMNKMLTKKVYSAHGLKTPQHVFLRGKDADDAGLIEIFRTFPHPYVVKPTNAGSSVGVSIVRSFPDFKTAVKKALEHSSAVLIEELISGREATCGVIENFRGKKIHALSPIEIIHPSKNQFFDYEAKYGGESREICPANFTLKVKEEIQNVATIAHNALHLRHYSRSDFIISPKGVYILETNTLPGLTPQSLVPKALEAGGTKFPDFLDHLITLALSRK